MIHVIIIIIIIIIFFKGRLRHMNHVVKKWMIESRAIVIQVIVVVLVIVFIMIGVWNQKIKKKSSIQNIMP